MAPIRMEKKGERDKDTEERERERTSAKLPG